MPNEKKIMCPKCGMPVIDIAKHVKEEHKEFKKLRIGNKVINLEDKKSKKQQ